MAKTHETSGYPVLNPSQQHRWLPPWPAAALCLGPLLGLACGSTPVVALRYEFGGCLGDGTTKLVATVTAPGRTFESFEYSPPGPGAQSIALRLPSDLSGTISVLLEAKNANNCLVASGTAQVDLSVKRDSNNPADDVRIPLSCLASPDCTQPTSLNPATQPELLWSLRCGSDGDDVGTGTAFDQLGNVYVVGSFSGRAGGPACSYTNKAGDPNRQLAKLTGGSFLIKLSPDGVVQWSRKLGATQGSAPSVQFDVRQPRLAVTPNGEVYVAGVAAQNARIETAPANLADGLFVARFNSSGDLSWQKSFSSMFTGPGPTGTRIGAIAAGSRNGQPVLAVAGDCVSTSLIVANDCQSASQFVMYFEGGDSLVNLTAKRFGQATATPGTFFNYSLTSVSLSATGRTSLTGSSGAQGLSAADAGISPQQGSYAMYAIRDQADGQWSGSFLVEPTQPGEFDSNNPADMLPYPLERQPNHNLVSTVDRLGSLYMAASFYRNSPSPRIQKFPASGAVAEWTSNMTTQDLSAGTHGHPIALSLDSDDNPILVFSYSKSWNLGGLVDLSAPGVMGYNSDLAIVKYSKSYGLDSGPRFFWKSPIRITLGNYGIFNLNTHKSTNRMSLVSRTTNSSVVLNDQAVPLTSAKAGKYDLVLLVMGPPPS